MQEVVVYKYRCLMCFKAFEVFRPVQNDETYSLFRNFNSDEIRKFNYTRGSQIDEIMTKILGMDENLQFENGEDRGFTATQLAGFLADCGPWELVYSNRCTRCKSFLTVKFNGPYKYGPVEELTYKTLDDQQIGDYLQSFLKFRNGA